MATKTSDHVPQSVGVSLTWKNLRYTLTKKGRCKKPATQKVILNGVDGSLGAGRLLAVMGPSGSGKTSFINVLADRTPKNSGASVSGEVLIDGIPRTQIPSFSRMASYVLQDDSLYPMLTVYETLLLAARFRLPAKIPLAEKRERVERLIDELGIRQARDTLIGDERHKGVSGGERKRTNVGVEIIGDPSLIFLDEPTSGLDAFQALNVMQLLRTLSRERGRTIVVSIHQPRSSIYALFDKLLLLANGSVTYSGDASAAVAYFGKLGHQCPQHYNPADFFIDLVSVDTSKEDKGDADRARFVLLYLRSLRSRLRDKVALIAPIFSSLFFSLIFSALWSKMDKGQKSIQDRTGALFFVTINQAFGGVFSVANSFPLEKKIVDRERTSGAYAVLPYYAAKWLAEFPFAAMGPMLFACVAYWLVGFEARAENFALFLAIIVMINMTAVSWGMLISSSTNSVEQATGFGPLVIIVFLLFGGFYVNTDNIPDSIAWINELSFFKWGFMAMAINEYQGLTFVNDDGVPCPDIVALNLTNGPSACAFVNGQQVLQLLTFENDSVGMCLLWLAVIALSVHTTAYLCLLRKRQRFATLEPPAKVAEVTATKGTASAAADTASSAASAV